jgi:hypothetical protein
MAGRQADGYKVTLYHSTPEAHLPNIKEVGLKSGMRFRGTSLTKPSTAKELAVRRMFDEERPPGVKHSQVDSLFFTWLPHASMPADGRMDFNRTFITAELGDDCLVANASYVVQAMKAVKGTEVAEDEQAKVRELARRYWAESMPLDVFERSYEMDQRRTHLHWVRSKGASDKLPMEIWGPDIMYNGDLPPERLGKALCHFKFRLVSGGYRYDMQLVEKSPLK